MNPAALLYSGIPPAGLGTYVRERMTAGVPWDHVAVNAWRSDRAQQVAAARAIGATIWLYGGPERWDPESWRESIAYIERECARLDAVGFIVDPENGWPEAWTANRARAEGEARALGAAMRDAATRWRVGGTSYYSFPARRALIEAAGTGVWWAVQMLGRTTQSAAAMRQWLDGWRALAGSRVIIGIGGWVSSPALGTAEGYRRYLEALPPIGGALAWDAVGAGPAYIARELTAYRARLSPVSAVGSTLARPAVLVLVVALVAFLWYKAR
jgi:hypothetical protein